MDKRQVKPVDESPASYESFVASGTIAAGDVVALVTSDTTGKTVKATDAVDLPVVGVAAEAASDGDTVRVQTYGVATVTVNAATVNISAGDQLSSTSGGNAQKAASPVAGEVLGFALEASTADNDSISVFVKPC